MELSNWKKHLKRERKFKDFELYEYDKRETLRIHILVERSRISSMASSSSNLGREHKLHVYSWD
jgi:hypothetical protein